MHFTFLGGKTQGGMEGGIRVPTLVRWPGVLPAEATLDQPTSQMDILPTIAHITQTKIPNDRIIDGKNMITLLSGDSQQSPHHILLHYCGTEVHAARITSTNSTYISYLHN